MLRTYPELVDLLFQTYTADVVIPETNVALTLFTQRLTMMHRQNAEALISRLLKCEEVCNE